MDSVPLSSFQHSYAGEFDMLSSEEREMWCKSNEFETSSKVENTIRNRYTNILSNESTRVKLNNLSHNNHNDYINANRISGYANHPGYIATQAPLVETMSHFWQMVYESMTPVIIMLTRETEDDCHVSKSERYWPCPGQTILCNDYLIDAVDRTVNDSLGMIERTFRIGRVVDKRKKNAKDIITDADSLMINDLSNLNTNENHSATPPSNHVDNSHTATNGSSTTPSHHNEFILTSPSSNSQPKTSNPSSSPMSTPISAAATSLHRKISANNTHKNINHSMWQTPARYASNFRSRHHNHQYHQPNTIDNTSPEDSEDLMKHLELIGPVLEVVQIQYIDWPDQDVPASPKTILDLCYRVDELCLKQWASTAPTYGPPIVHCSAGVGRTGTFIAIDRTLRRLYDTFSSVEHIIAKKKYSPQAAANVMKNDLNIKPVSVDEICELVRRLKRERSKMVQTAEQYRFIYLAVLEGMNKWAKNHTLFNSYQIECPPSMINRTRLFINGHSEDDQRGSDSNDNDNDDDDEDEDDDEEVFISLSSLFIHNIKAKNKKKSSVPSIKHIDDDDDSSPTNGSSRTINNNNDIS